MAKDRSAPFSSKHRRYWLPILGGMIVIGIINLILGFALKPDVYEGPTERIIPGVPDANPGDAATAVPNR